MKAMIPVTRGRPAMWLPPNFREMIRPRTRYLLGKDDRRREWSHPRTSTGLRETSAGRSGVAVAALRAARRSGGLACGSPGAG